MGLNRRQLSIAVDRYNQFLATFQPLLGQWLLQPDEDPSLLQRLSETAAEAKAILERMSRTMGLSPSSPNSYMWALAQITSLWTTLEDLHPDKLRRYGEVDQSASSEWEGQLSRLKVVTRELIASLESLAARRGRS